MELSGKASTDTKKRYLLKSCFGMRFHENFKEFRERKISAGSHLYSSQPILIDLNQTDYESFFKK